MELIEHNGRLIALIYHPEAIQQGSAFFTPPGLSMQVGFLQYPAGHRVRPHQHEARPAPMTGVAEIVIIQSGSCEVDLFSAEGSPVSTCTLRAGDAIVMVEGGHAFRMTDDTRLYTIKPGPYTGDRDKQIIED